MTSCSASCIRVSITRMPPGEMGQNRIKVSSGWMMILWPFWCCCSAVKKFAARWPIRRRFNFFLSFENFAPACLNDFEIVGHVLLWPWSTSTWPGCHRNLNRNRHVYSLAASAAAPQWSQFTWWPPFNALDCNRVFFNFSANQSTLGSCQPVDRFCPIF